MVLIDFADSGPIDFAAVEQVFVVGEQTAVAVADSVEVEVVVIDFVETAVALNIVAAETEFVRVVAIVFETVWVVVAAAEKAYFDLITMDNFYSVDYYSF